MKEITFSISAKTIRGYSINLFQTFIYCNLTRDLWFHSEIVIVIYTRLSSWKSTKISRRNQFPPLPLQSPANVGKPVIDKPLRPTGASTSGLRARYFAKKNVAKRLHFFLICFHIQNQSMDLRQECYVLEL